MARQNLQRSVLRMLVARAAAYCGRLYCHYMPTARGKFFVWKKLKNSGLIVDARTSFGAWFRLDLRDWVQRSIYAFGEWEPVITSYLLALLKPGDVFIDIGANIGYYSVLAGLRVGDDGAVYAIEPSPTTFAALTSNISRNRLTNVQSYNVAVSDKPGELTLWARDKNNIGKSTVIDHLKGDGAIVDARVPALPLPQIIPVSEILRARVIKIDVEGAEWLVLNGIRDLLPKLSSQTEILFELDSESLRIFGTTIDACLSIFRNAGFTPYVIDTELDQHYTSQQSEIKPLTETDRFRVSDLLFRREADHSKA